MKINGASQIKANSIPLSALQEAAVAQLGSGAPQSEVYPATYATAQEVPCPFFNAGSAYPAPTDTDLAQYLNGNTPVEGQTFAAKFVASNGSLSVSVARLTRQLDGTWKAPNPDEPSTMLLPFGAIVITGQTEEERKYYVATQTTFQEIDGIGSAQKSITQTIYELTNTLQTTLDQFNEIVSSSLMIQRTRGATVVDPNNAKLNTEGEPVVFHTLALNGVQLRLDADYTVEAEGNGGLVYIIKPERVQAGDEIDLNYLTNKPKVVAT
ncbi:hypothetical protein Dxin01_00162 [Deinococcus xinjiangensis]|uniref:Uncharacterized protein n=1 Tax=Deinococcus xinjiangensis TaxID=457454 RepID=A0ABP9V6W8_9DEIO